MPHLQQLLHCRIGSGRCCRCILLCHGSADRRLIQCPADIINLRRYLTMTSSRQCCFDSRRSHSPFCRMALLQQLCTVPAACRQHSRGQHAWAASAAAGCQPQGNSGRLTAPQQLPCRPAQPLHIASGLTIEPGAQMPSAQGAGRLHTVTAARLTAHYGSHSPAACTVSVPAQPCLRASHARGLLRSGPD